MGRPSTQFIKVCEICGSEFISRISEKNHRYCSRECSDKSRFAPANTFCEICGTPFHVPPGYATIGKGKYCSRLCFAKAHSKTMFGRFRKRIKKTCSICQKEFEIIPSWERETNYCSRTCLHESRRRVRGENHPLKKVYPTMTCQNCSKEYTVKPSLAKRTKFCSRGCQGAWIKSHTTSPTSIELAVAHLLDSMHIRYDSQKTFGKYVTDFYLPGYNVVIECDGTYWHSLLVRIAKDIEKDFFLRAHGTKVLRLPESKIKKDISWCRAQIETAIA